MGPKSKLSLDKILQYKILKANMDVRRLETRNIAIPKTTVKIFKIDQPNALVHL